MNKVSWIVTDQAITVNYDGETHIVKRSDALADKLIKALKDNKSEEIPNLVSAAKRVEMFSNGNFTVKDGKVFVNGVEAPQVLSDKIVRFSNEGLPYQPLIKFAERLQQNPSYRSVNELFGFLEKNDHPITEDGCFLAFRRVRGDYMDIYTGTVDNHPGKIPSMPRNQVDEDCNRTCSRGYHASSWQYAHTQYASSNPETDIMLEVKIDPADVVAIPTDYNNAKMRICKYEVLGVVTTPFDPSECLRGQAEPCCDDTEKFDVREEEDEDKDICCSGGLCGCPEKCDCDCINDYCDECDCNEYNFDTCDDCGEYVDYCICEEEEEAKNPCTGCGCSCPAKVKTDEDPYPYEDELDDEI